MCSYNSYPFRIIAWVIFNLYTVVSCPECFQLVLQICLIISTKFLCEQLFSLMRRNKVFEISGWTDTNNDNSKNTNVKSEINKVSTNKRFQFLENIVLINETSEQNANGYCNVEFTLNQTNASFICGIKVILVSWIYIYF